MHNEIHEKGSDSDVSVMVCIATTHVHMHCRTTCNMTSFHGPCNTYERENKERTRAHIHKTLIKETMKVHTSFAAAPSFSSIPAQVITKLVLSCGHTVGPVDGKGLLLSELDLGFCHLAHVRPELDAVGDPLIV